jgi:N-acetylglucosaminyl-diphospho-decaprenol L-rhamnosyltransferase
VRHAGLLSLVVVNYNGGEHVVNCLESVVSRDDVPTEIVVVDNASTDGSLDLIRRRFAGVTVLAAKANVGYAAANNHGLPATRGEWIGLLNPDTFVPPGALGALTGYLASHPRVAAVGPALRWPDGTAQPYSHGGDPTPLYLARRALASRRGRALHAWDGGPAREVDWVSGACLIARRAAFEHVGPLDPTLFLYFEDNDWCRRCRLAGWRISFLPSVSVVHLSRPNAGDTNRRHLYRQSLRRFYRKHYGWLASFGLDLALRLAR